MKTLARNDATDMLSKVPEVTLIFWIIKIAATTLGETGGDAVSMSMNFGYLLGTVIFAAVFIVTVAAQIRAKRFYPSLYWTTVIATTTVGTTLADFADRSLGIGYAGGSSLLFILLMTSLAVWYRTLGSVSADSVGSPKSEMFYWATIMFSQTLGTALGDWTADTAGRRLRRIVAACCRGLSVDPHLPYRAVLGGLHPDPSARRRGWRLSRQAGGRRRPGLEPLYCISGVAGIHLAVHWTLPATLRRARRPRFRQRNFCRI